MHDPLSTLRYKTTNVYRFNLNTILFISDPSHLIKTIRNSFSRGKLWCAIINLCFMLYSCSVMDKKMIEFDSRHDGEIEVHDVTSHLPCSWLQELSLVFYKNKVLIVTIAIKGVELHKMREIRKAVRRLCITSSNVNSIDQCKSTTASAPLVHCLLYSNFKGNTSTRYGLAQLQKVLGMAGTK